MRRLLRPRRPRFGLVLIAVLLPVVVVLLVASRPLVRPPEMIRSGPARACASARASAEARAQTTIQALAEARLPITVSERVRTARGVVLATRSETIVDQARLKRQVVVERAALITRRACARGSTADSARSAALEHAYRAALRRARVEARAQARKELEALAAKLRASDLAQARKLASTKARAQAPAVRAQLAREDLALAAARRAQKR